MTEDELLEGVTGALQAGGWLWHHVRRSDRALTMGTPGFPDIIAVHPERGHVVAIECKVPGGRLRPGQWAWLAAFTHALGEGGGRIVTPDGYDALIVELVGDRGRVRQAPDHMTPRGDAGARTAAPNPAAERAP
jgi:hypothetical protein